MISHVSGVVESVRGTTIVLDTGWLGVELNCTARCSTATRVGEQHRIPAALVVREDGWTLFGFADVDERAVFSELQAVKGIGPRLAMALLSTLTTQELRSAVAAGDARALVRVPGIGLKGAQRLVIDLRDRLTPAQGGAGAGSATAPGAGHTDVLAQEHSWQSHVGGALVGLGWTASEAANAVSIVAVEATPGGRGVSEDGSPDLALLLRLALTSLDRRTPA